MLEAIGRIVEDAVDLADAAHANRNWRRVTIGVACAVAVVVLVEIFLRTHHSNHIRKRGAKPLKDGETRDKHHERTRETESERDEVWCR